MLPFSSASVIFCAKAKRAGWSAGFSCWVIIILYGWKERSFLTILLKVRLLISKLAECFLPDRDGLLISDSRTRSIFSCFLTVLFRPGGFFLFTEPVFSKFWTHKFTVFREGTASFGFKLKWTRNARTALEYEPCLKICLNINTRCATCHRSMFTSYWGEKKPSSVYFQTRVRGNTSSYFSASYN